MFPDFGAFLTGMFGPGGNPSMMMGPGFDPAGNMPLQAGNAAPPPLPLPEPPVMPPQVSPMAQPGSQTAAERIGVGAALTGNVPIPRARPAVGPGMPLDITPPGNPAGAAANAQGGSVADRIAQTLKGVKMPAAPETQRISTPAAPRPTTAIKGGEILALLNMMGGGGGVEGMKLPSTLGDALGRR